jgi:hypothetical protein
VIFVLNQPFPVFYWPDGAPDWWHLGQRPATKAEQRWSSWSSVTPALQFAERVFALGTLLP